MRYEQQSGETISDSIRIGCVVNRMEKSSLKEHLLLVNEIESIELAKRTATHPQPMQLDALQQPFRGTCNKCGKVGHKAVDCFKGK
eukprot:2160083-Karenia_brevis.AAC.1